MFDVLYPYQPLVRSRLGRVETHCRSTRNRGPFLCLYLCRRHNFCPVNGIFIANTSGIRADLIITCCWEHIMHYALCRVFKQYNRHAYLINYSLRFMQNLKSVTPNTDVLAYCDILGTWEKLSRYPEVFILCQSIWYAKWDIKESVTVTRYCKWVHLYLNFCDHPLNVLRKVLRLSVDIELVSSVEDTF